MGTLARCPHDQEEGGGTFALGDPSLHTGTTIPLSSV